MVLNTNIQKGELAEFFKEKKRNIYLKVSVHVHFSAGPQFGLTSKHMAVQARTCRPRYLGTWVGHLTLVLWLE